MSRWHQLLAQIRAGDTQSISIETVQTAQTVQNSLPPTTFEPIVPFEPLPYRNKNPSPGSGSTCDGAENALSVEVAQNAQKRAEAESEVSDLDFDPPGAAPPLPEAADLEWLSPSAHAGVIAEPNGIATAYTRKPGGRWFSPLPVRPPRFDTPRRADRTIMPICTGWCSGCGAASTWRADSPSSPNASVTHWRCIRCGAADSEGKPPQNRTVGGPRR